jgi:hypothetical protein
MDFSAGVAAEKQAGAETRSAVMEKNGDFMLERMNETTLAAATKLQQRPAQDQTPNFKEVSNGKP